MSDIGKQTEARGNSLGCLGLSRQPGWAKNGLRMFPVKPPILWRHIFWWWYFEPFEFPFPPVFFRHQLDLMTFSRIIFLSFWRCWIHSTNTRILWTCLLARRRVSSWESSDVASGVGFKPVREKPRVGWRSCFWLYHSYITLILCNEFYMYLLFISTRGHVGWGVHCAQWLGSRHGNWRCLFDIQDSFDVDKHVIVPHFWGLIFHVWCVLTDCVRVLVTFFVDVWDDHRRSLSKNDGRMCMTIHSGSPYPTRTKCGEVFFFLMSGVTHQSLLHPSEDLFSWLGQTCGFGCIVSGCGFLKSTVLRVLLPTGGPWDWLNNNLTKPWHLIATWSHFRLREVRGRRVEFCCTKPLRHLLFFGVVFPGMCVFLLWVRMESSMILL